MPNTTVKTHILSVFSVFSVVPKNTIRGAWQYNIPLGILACLLFGAMHLPVTAATAYDVSGATNISPNPYHGSSGLVFTVTQSIQLDQLGITADTASNTMDADGMFTRLWLLNDPDGDTSNATKLAEVHFNTGLAATSGPHNTSWNFYLQNPDSGAGVTLTPGHTYVISNTTDDSPSRFLWAAARWEPHCGSIQPMV